MQTVFQDPYASLDPKNKVIDLIAEGMDIHHLYTGPAERREKVQALMEQVGLNPSGIDRYPYEFSGGMRQRIGIAVRWRWSPGCCCATSPFRRWMCPFRPRSSICCWTYGNRRP